MIRHGEEVEMNTEDASGGQKRGIVRYVLLISTGLAILALSIIWMTGAATGPEDPTPAPSESISEPTEPPAGTRPLPDPNP
ncbi:hypothetical protein [Blastomonas sp. AAP53]|uniref:hypothetical protein n=1 Tax=Blastomonas sp. AAP53 TaxID=1248760 RepID=UPI00126743DC|nr:hypothetical protein [Blastomonas sp. AAP53]